MTPPPSTPLRPTDAELEILAALWQGGPGTVREICERLRKDVGYTTVLKLLQIMTEKGLVTRNEAQRSHVYSARHSEKQMQKRLVRDFMKRAFAGEADKLVMQALSAKKLTATELSNIRQMLDDLEAHRE